LSSSNSDPAREATNEIPGMHNDRIASSRDIGASLAPDTGHDLPKLPARPTLIDILTLRLHKPKFGLPIAAAAHGAQCATLAMRAGCDEETVLACLLHDIGLGVIRPDHGWWGAQLVEPYVSERVSWAIRDHQALRYYPDPAVGYEYPEMYVQMLGPDYEPPEYIAAAYQEARQHRWYMTAAISRCTTTTASIAAPRAISILSLTS
jgi:hypothetical protein